MEPSSGAIEPATFASIVKGGRRTEARAEHERRLGLVLGRPAFGPSRAAADNLRVSASEGWPGTRSSRTGMTAHVRVATVGTLRLRS